MKKSILFFTCLVVFSPALAEVPSTSGNNFVPFYKTKADLLNAIGVDVYREELESAPISPDTYKSWDSSAFYHLSKSYGAGADAASISKCFHNGSESLGLIQEHYFESAFPMIYLSITRRGVGNIEANASQATEQALDALENGCGPTYRSAAEILFSDFSRRVSDYNEQLVRRGFSGKADIARRKSVSDQRSQCINSDEYQRWSIRFDILEEKRQLEQYQAQGYDVRQQFKALEQAFFYYKLEGGKEERLQDITAGEPSPCAHFDKPGHR